MKKVVSKQAQLDMLTKPNAIELMREYVSLNKSFSPGLNRGDDLLIASLPHEDAKQMKDNCGNVFTETWVKMLDVFPKEVSKELLLSYLEESYVWDRTLLTAIDVFSKEDAKDVIVAGKTMSLAVFNKIINVFSQEETKDILIELAKREVSSFDDKAQLKILRVFSKEDALAIMKACASNLAGLEWGAQLRIFDVFSKEEVKELLKSLIDNDQYIHYETLEKIVQVFPKEDAKSLVEDFFAGDCGRNEYDQEDVISIRKLLK